MFILVLLTKKEKIPSLLIGFLSSGIQECKKTDSILFFLLTIVRQNTRSLSTHNQDIKDVPYCSEDWRYLNSLYSDTEVIG